MILSGFFDLPWWGYLAAALALTHVTIAAVTIYLHRCQAHRALELHPVVSHFFRFWLWLTTGMITKEWAAIHRKHHAKCETVDDPHSHQALDAERSVMWRLGGGCALPLGAFAIAEHGRVHVTAVVATADGATILRSSAEARFAEEAAEQVAKGLIAQGAEAILAEVTADGPPDGER